MTDVEQIKQKLNIVDVISEYVPIKKLGRNFRASCPFHSEKTPSFYVSPERQVWHCFGCGAGGDVFSFLMEMEKLEFVEALRILSERTGIKLTDRLELTSDQKRKQRLLEIHDLASEFYHFLLVSHKTGKRALTYLQERGVRQETVKTFGLGYAPNSWEATSKYLRKKSFTDAEIIDAGLAIRGRSGIYDRFRARLIFPIRDHRGGTIAFAGRLLEREAQEAKYINSPETAIYTKGNTLYGLDIAKEAIRKENMTILVEGEFDLLSSFQDGVTNVVAIKGSALTEAQIQLLRRFSDRLTFALDSDIAGDAAARRGIELADRLGLLMSVVQLPAGKDPDECVRAGGGLWRKALSQAIPIYDYFLESAKRRFDAASVEGKKRISDELIPILPKIENPIIRSHYIRKLAEVLSVSEETVAESVEVELRKLKTTPGAENKSERVATRRTRIEQLEDLIAAILLQSEDESMVTSLGKELRKEQFTQPPVARILAEIKKHLTATAKLPLVQHLGQTPELAATLNRLILVDTSLVLAKHRQAWRGVLREFEIEVLRREMRTVTTNISKLEAKEGREDELRSLNDKLAELAKKLRQLQA